MGQIDGDTPGLRMFALLELVATHDGDYTVQSLVEQTQLPKPTVHRMVQQLLNADLLSHGSRPHRFRTGPRMRQVAQSVLANDTHHAARHSVLTELVSELGESCNLTALAGNQVIYLDRVETDEPLRIHLGPGTRVPAHASASGKVLMSQLGAMQRKRILGATPLPSYTAHTVTDPHRLGDEVKQAAADGYALDRQEYLEGLVCIAVPISDNETGSNNLCLAVQAPITRFSPEGLSTLLPRLRAAADTIHQTEQLSSDSVGHQAWSSAGAN